MGIGDSSYVCVGMYINEYVGEGLVRVWCCEGVVRV